MLTPVRVVSSATSVGKGATARSRVRWPEFRRALREAHESQLVHAVRTRPDGAIDYILRRPARSMTTKQQPMPTESGAAQQEVSKRKQRSRERMATFKRDYPLGKAAAVAGKPMPPPPPRPTLPATNAWSRPLAIAFPPLSPRQPANTRPPTMANAEGGGLVELGKRDAAQAETDRTPTKSPESMNERKKNRASKPSPLATSNGSSNSSARRMH